jgi:hypothetical protein
MLFKKRLKVFFCIIFVVVMNIVVAQKTIIITDESRWITTAKDLFEKQKYVQAQQNFYKVIDTKLISDDISFSFI